MNREIEFRGMTIATKQWVYGSYLHQYWSSTNNQFIDAICFNDGAYQPYRPQVIPESVTQYTGLKDANGRFYPIPYFEDCDDSYYSHGADNFKVIGNIFENSDLL